MTILYDTEDCFLREIKESLLIPTKIEIRYETGDYRKDIFSPYQEFSNDYLSVIEDSFNETFEWVK